MSEVPFLSEEELGTLDHYDQILRCGGQSWRDLNDDDLHEFTSLIRRYREFFGPLEQRCADDKYHQNFARRTNRERQFE